MIAPPPPPGLPRRAAGAGAAFVLLEQVVSLIFYDRFRSWFRVTNPSLAPPALDAAARDAVIKTVGAIHVALQLPLAVAVVADRGRAFAAGFDDPATLYAATPTSHALVAVSVGYFSWDILSLAVRSAAARRPGARAPPPHPALLLHGTLCAIGFWYGALTGWLSYYGAVFLIWEASTPLVYWRWTLATAGLQKTPLYRVVGLSMTAAFFVARIAFGLTASARWWAVAARELAAPTPRGIAPAILIGYDVANIGMNGLNLYWFSKMVAGIVKHFGQKQRAAAAGAPAAAAPKPPPSPLRPAGGAVPPPVAPAPAVKSVSPMRPFASPFAVGNTVVVEE